MPLRDHFRPPISRLSSWESVHAMLPAMMVLNLGPKLPAKYVAEPRVHLGTYFEVDIGTLERGDDGGAVEPRLPFSGNGHESNGGVATATLAPPTPSLAVEVRLDDQYAYEVLIYDIEYDRRLVAAVEIVSPANKDRPDNRAIFVAKCATLLSKGICVSIVDLVTVRRFNMYTELLALLDQNDPGVSDAPPAIYAVTCRSRKTGNKTILETWTNRLEIGQPLPTVPIWLTETEHIVLDLEPPYEETCKALRIP